ncbi:hypothetical protein tb265_50390 [Gemmatimonadetes bacterium T265]|nr:hypothetical protein tb265_50390 [Gemmatimonadetes bacterium T265]
MKCSASGDVVPEAKGAGGAGPGQGECANLPVFSRAKMGDRPHRPRQGADLGPDPLGEEGEDARVDVVRLRELAGRFGEVAHLARVRDHHRELRGRERGDHGELVSARCFQDHEGGRAAGEALDECANPRVRVRDRPGRPARPDRHHQLAFRDIDADEHRLSPRMGVPQRSAVLRFLAASAPSCVIRVWHRVPRTPATFRAHCDRNRHAALTNARCSPPRQHRAGARFSVHAESRTR